MNVGKCQTKYMILSQTYEYKQYQYIAPKCVSLNLPGSMIFFKKMSINKII